MMLDPGLLYVLAATLPVVAGLLLIILRQRAEQWAGWLVIGCLVVSAVISLVGLILFQIHTQAARDQLQPILPWSGSVPWMHLSFLRYDGPGGYHYDAPGVELHLGYQVDTLTTVFFLAITAVALCIALVTIRSRPGVWFVAHFSFLVGIMLLLVLADNLVQVYVCWVLLSLCCYFLIGFYGEQQVAFQAFIINCVGDVGFLVAMAILWTFTGTLSLVTVREDVRDVLGNVVLEDGQSKQRIDQLSLIDALHVPSKDTHDEPFTEKGAEAGQMCRVNQTSTTTGSKKLELAETGPLVVVWNQETLNSHYHKPEQRRFDAFDPLSKSAHGQGLKTMPYWMLTLAGLALLLAVVCKWIQPPLLTRPPDVLIGSASISAVTGSLMMMTAGVYLLIRVFPLFTHAVVLTSIFTGFLIALLMSLLVWRHRDHLRTQKAKTGWRGDAALQRWFVQPVMLAGRWLYLLDRRLWDGLVHLIVNLAQFVARLEQRVDNVLVDGLPSPVRSWTLRIDLILLALIGVAVAAIVVAMTR